MCCRWQRAIIFLLLPSAGWKLVHSMAQAACGVASQQRFKVHACADLRCFPIPWQGQLVVVLPLDCSIPGPFEDLQHVGQGKCLPCLPDHLQARTSSCHPACLPAA